MIDTTSILYETSNFLGRHVIYPNADSHIAHALWILGSGFLENDDIPVFDNYPILAFLSPEEDSGKTRALDVTELLAHNAINGGSHTAASLCREIDGQQPELITIILDELDEIFTYNRDNSDYLRLLNNGYQRGKVIARCDMNGNKTINTPAYCPKAVAGLSVAKLKRTTRSRMIIIRMRPMKKGENVGRHIDKQAATELRDRISAWRATVVENLKSLPEDSLSNLTQRAAQIWHPLLAIASSAGGDWFDRAGKAAAFFVDKQKPADTLGKLILIELYKAYASGKHPRGIWSETFAVRLHEAGFSLDIDKHKIAYHLGESGYGIHTKELKINGVNKNGYVWDACIPFFEDYLPEDARTLIHEDYGTPRAVGDKPDQGTELYNSGADINGEPCIFRGVLIT
ncbi:MAG TPA: DUF3631 domain-containing protein [Xanthobacteraceae bacterium]